MSKLTDHELTERVFSHYKGNLLYHAGTFWAWDEIKRLWLPLDDKAIEQKIDEIDNPNTTGPRLTSALKVLKARVYKDKMNLRPDLLNLKDGRFLDPLSELICPPTKDYLHTIQLGVGYYPKATCPRWDKFLDEIFEPDADKEEKKLLLQEIFGYCLIPDTTQEKMFILYGRGANGKDKTLDVLKYIVGKENISHVELSDLRKGFRLAELYGKLLNVYTELDVSRRLPIDQLKNLISGGDVTAEKKFKDPFTFKNKARFVVACNKLPKIDDKTYGFWRRVIVIPYNRRFKPEERDLNLKEKLFREADGIFMWALEGLKRLRRQGYFTAPKSCVEFVNDYQLDQDPVARFLHENCEPDPEGKLTTTTLYLEYQNWCRENRHYPISIKEFGSELNRLGIRKWGSGNQFRPLKFK